MYQIIISNQAKKDVKKASSSNLKPKILEIFNLLEQEPFREYPEYEKLLGEDPPTYSRRINKQHRVVYQVIEEQKIVKILRMWTHYE